MPKVKVSNKVEDFSIELNESEGCWTVTIKEYTGITEEVIVPPSFGGMPVKPL